MKLTIDNFSVVQSDRTGLWSVIFNIPNQLVDEVNKLSLKEKLKTVEIKILRKKRSLTANGALWGLLNEMAIQLHTTKDELYLDMLDRYGVFTTVRVKPEAVYRVKHEWKTTRELGPVIIDGEKWIEMQCYYGSSGYDTKEFSVLLDGVISEASELGIHFITEEERNSIINNWEE